MTTIQQELEDELFHHRDRVLVITGAGVSIASTDRNPVASWLGLLRNGVEYCATHFPGLRDGWAARMKAQLDQGDMVEMVSVAEDISTRLGFPNGGEYARWLTETVGSLRVKSPQLIKALEGCDVQIATTNYDELIEEVTGRKAITWIDRALAMQFLRGDIRDVLHLHGLWRNPSSVILGIRSYETILNDEPTQETLRAFLMNRTLVFIGCGAGLEDPNFGALLKWSQRVLVSSIHRHFRLACRPELDECAKQHPTGSRIAVLEYGAAHQDLVGFLEGIALRVRQRSTPPDPLQQLQAAQADLERRHAGLTARRTELGAGDYLRGLLEIAKELWQLGGRRSAWMLLAGAFDRDASALAPADRLRIGIETSQMMVDDEMPDRAAPILDQLQQDAGNPTVPEELTVLFYQLQVRCFRDLCAYHQALQAIQNALTTTADEFSRTRLTAEWVEILLLQGEEERLPGEGEKGV